MNHKLVTQKWYGGKYRETQKLGYQCVAWAKKYCDERGYPLQSFLGSAITGWDTGHPFDDSWKRIDYTGFNYPSEGDIIFWSERRCKNGHVAVANRFCNPFILRYSDQNGTGNEDSIQPRWCGYSGVIGWFHRQ